jgi:SAM-dependent methyltransferase
MGYQCPRCGARDRHRLLAVFLREHGHVAGSPPRVLHFAPEPPIRAVLDELGMTSYLSVDLEPGVADLAADITALPLEERSFDLVICSHVLEHVPEDRIALRELARVVSDRGQVLILTPVSHKLEATIEDPAAGPEERLRMFGQDDHVRVYGPDLVDRIEAAGLTAATFDSGDVNEQTRARAGLDMGKNPYGLRNELFVCRRTSDLVSDL